MSEGQFFAVLFVFCPVLGFLCYGYLAGWFDNP
jgi:hypothetical protein